MIVQRFPTQRLRVRIAHPPLVARLQASATRACASWSTILQRIALHALVLMIAVLTVVAAALG
jgi:hypothetical protein